MAYTIQTFPTATPAIVASAAYASGDNIGGKLTFTGAFVTPKCAGALQAVLVTDQAKQVANVDLILFSEDPSGSTFTDNAAQAIADADLSKIVAIVNITTHCSLSDNSVSYGTGLSDSVYSTCGGPLYGCLVARATPTYANAADVIVRLDILQD